MGDLQWVRSVSGITNDDLAPLMPLLGTSTRADGRRSLTKEQEQALDHIIKKVLTTVVQRKISDLPLQFLIVNSSPNRKHLIGLIIQIDSPRINILEWVFLSYQPKNTVCTRIELLANMIIKGRRRICDLTGQEPETLFVPIAQNYLDWLLATSEMFQIALAEYPGTVTNNYPSTKILPLLQNQDFEDIPYRSEVPVEGLTVFTDAGRKSKRAAIAWYDNNQWNHQLLTGHTADSLQTLELRAVLWAFQRWPDKPLNVISDSLYVVGTVQRLERAMIKSLKNNTLYMLLMQLLFLLNQRTKHYFVTHIRSHQFDQGLSIGNNIADKLVATIWKNQNINLFEQARLSHEFLHQSAKVLAKQFDLKLSDARGIVQSCPACQKSGFGLGLGVNPRGLGALQLWQMDVTHITEFGRQKYVHVSIDTYSRAIWATAQTGETAKHVVKHMCAAIAALGIPQEIKTDNGPAYISKTFEHFCHLWGIRRITGIPHSPTGQAIVERAHATLKSLLQKQKGGEIAPAERLAKAIYVLNYLRLTGDRESPPIVIHHMSFQSGIQKIDSVSVKVRYRDLKTGEWKGPAEIKMTGRGYVCVLTDEGPRWVPSRWVKPWREESGPQQELP